VSVGVPYGSTCRQVAECTIAQAVDERADILKTRAGVLIFDDFGDNRALMLWCIFG